MQCMQKKQQNKIKSKKKNQNKIVHVQFPYFSLSYGTAKEKYDGTT